MPTDIETKIENVAEAEKSITVDGETATAHGLDELMRSDEYMRKVRAAQYTHRGLSFATIKQPGARGS